MYIAKTKISYPLSLYDDIMFVKRTFSLDYSQTDDDDYINSLMKPAIEQTEGQINQDIALTNNIVRLKDFTGTEVVIPQGNFNEILSIVNNDSSTLITTYTTEKNYNEFRINLDASAGSSMTLNFTTGYKEMSDIPEGLKFAILVKTCDIYYHQRGSYSNNFEKYDSTWESMCEQYKLLK